MKEKGREKRESKEDIHREGCQASWTHQHAMLRLTWK
jgi:hypothetical protein